jgi:hypothetical protein
MPTWPKHGLSPLRPYPELHERYRFTMAPVFSNWNQPYPVVKDLKAPSRLFELPVELRHMIYQLVLRGDFIFYSNQPRSSWVTRQFGNKKRGVLELAELSKEDISAVKPEAGHIVQYMTACWVDNLLHISQQIRKEAQPIFYREVTLCISMTSMYAPSRDLTHPTRSLEYCLGRPLTVHLPSLQLLSINVHFAPNMDWFFDHFPALKRVTFTGFDLKLDKAQRYDGDVERSEHEWNERYVRDRLGAIYTTQHFGLRALVERSREFEIRALCSLELQCLCHGIYAYPVSVADGGISSLQKSHQC